MVAAAIAAVMLVSGGILVGARLADGSSVSVTPLSPAPGSTAPLQISQAQPGSPPADGPEVCGPDQADALQSALTQLPPEPVTGARWDSNPPSPSDTNYNPCADLSTILVSIEGGTGSSPWQALMFHRGRYLGTGTSEAYGFTSLNSAASTTDTVVLTYESGQSCTACSDGVFTNVRYHWDGMKVQMLDPAPPGSTNGGATASVSGLPPAAPVTPASPDSGDPGSGPSTSSEVTQQDRQFLQDDIALGQQHGWTVGHPGTLFSDPFGPDDLVAIRLGHSICESIALQHETPKSIDENMWWALRPDQGKYITKAAITDLCPRWLPLEYW